MIEEGKNISHRFNYEDKAYNDRFISNRASGAAEKIAREMGLQTAREVQQQRLYERRLAHPEMALIKDLAHETLRASGACSVSGFVAAFNKAGAPSGFRSEAYYNKQGAFQGLRFYAGDEKFKASEIDHSLSRRQLEQMLEERLAA